MYSGSATQRDRRHRDRSERGQVVRGVDPGKLAELLLATFGPNEYEVYVWRSHINIQAPRELTTVTMPISTQFCVTVRLIVGASE